MLLLTNILFGRGSFIAYGFLARDGVVGVVLLKPLRELHRQRELVEKI